MFNIFSKREENDFVAAEFITRFIKPGPIHAKFSRMFWQEKIGKNYNEIISKYQKRGYIKKPNLLEGVSISTIKELKPILKKHGLKVSGKKTELVNRVIKNLPSEAKKLWKTNIVDNYSITEKGIELVKKYELERQKRKKVAINKAWEQICEDNIEGACRTINKYIRWLPKDFGGIGIDWDDPDEGVLWSLKDANNLLNHANEVWFSNEIQEDYFNEILYWTIEKFLWPSNIYEDREIKINKKNLNRTLDDYYSLFVSYIKNLDSLETAKETAKALDIKEKDVTVTVSTANDHYVCKKCENISSQKFNLNSVPVLPYPECESDYCRCSYHINMFDE